MKSKVLFFSSFPKEVNFSFFSLEMHGFSSAAPAPGAYLEDGAVGSGGPGTPFPASQRASEGFLQSHPTFQALLHPRCETARFGRTFGWEGPMSPGCWQIHLSQWDSFKQLDGSILPTKLFPECPERPGRVSKQSCNREDEAEQLAWRMRAH